MYSMHIAFGVDDAYIPYICVTIKSIIENNKEDVLYFHILSDFLSDKMLRLLNEVIEGYANVSLKVHIIDNNRLIGLKDSWSMQAWYRVFLPNVLDQNLHRVLYLDADTVVTGTLSDLFSLDMADKSIAAVLDIESYNLKTFNRCGYDYRKKYVCSGVMLMNLDYWRKHHLTEFIVDWAKKNVNKIQFPDQDAINYVCQDSKILLPLKYGILNCFFYNQEILNSEYQAEIKECILNPIIIHYAGQNPWKIELAKHLLNHEWDKYNYMLKHPAKRHYITKGMNLIKLHIWNLFHPNANKKYKENINKQIAKILNL